MSLADGVPTEKTLSLTAVSRLRDHNGRLPAFTSIGGYPLFYATCDECVLCAECANDPRDGHGGSEFGDPAVTGDVYWEGDPMECDECGAEIESAYGPIEDDTAEADA